MYLRQAAKQLFTVGEKHETKYILKPPFPDRGQIRNLSS